MPRTAEDAALPKVVVGGKEFPIGPVTIYQIYSAKNLVVSVLMAWRIRNAKRQAEVATKAMNEAKDAHDDVRANVAAKLGIDVQDIIESQFYEGLGEYVQKRIRAAEGETGYSEDAAGMLIDILGALSEDQIAMFARLLLDRSTQSRVTLEFVEQHFNLEWFTEALGYLLQFNHIPTLIKNLQRLTIMFNMQTEAPAETPPASVSTNA